MKAQVRLFTLLVIMLTFMFLAGGVLAAPEWGVRPALAAEGSSCAPLALSLSASALTAREVKKNITQSPEVVGQIGGDLNSVAVQGIYAYVGVGPRLVILNISNSAQPVVVGQTPVLPGIVQAVTVAGNYAYVAVFWSGLHIINITNPAAPIEVGLADFLGGTTDIVVMGSYAYLIAGQNFLSLHIYNISNPAHPVEVSSYDLDEPNHLDVAGTYAYVATTYGLRIINISNPAVPVAVGVYHPTSWIRDVKVKGNYAYVAGDGFHVVNITNPAAPLETGSYAMEAETIVVADNFAYLTGTRSDKYGLRIVDVSNPAILKGVGFYQIPGLSYDRIATDIAVGSNCVYIAQNAAFGENQGHYYISGGLNIINVASSTVPVQAGFYPVLGAVNRVTVADHTIYAVKEPVYGEMGEAAGGLSLVNVLDPARPRGIGNYYPPSSWAVNSVAVVGQYAYITARFVSDNFGEGSLRIVNIANPVVPIEVGFIQTPGFANDVVVAGGYAYIAESPGFIVEQRPGGGLRIFDINNPAAPQEVGFSPIPEGAQRITVAGSYAYLAALDEGLWILDISNPVAPHQVGVYPGSHVEDVAVAGNYAYVATEDGLQILNIAEPANPTEAGSYKLRRINSIAVEGNYAYIGAPVLIPEEFIIPGGVGVVEISNPAAPTEVSFYNLPGTVSDVAAADGYIYVADDKGGLTILHFTGELVPPVPSSFLPLIHK